MSRFAIEYLPCTCSMRTRPSSFSMRPSEMPVEGSMSSRSTVDTVNVSPTFTPESSPAFMNTAPFSS